MQNVFTYRGNSVTANLSNSDNGHYVKYTKDGVNRKFVVQNLIVDMMQRKMYISYNHFIEDDNENNVAQTSGGRYDGNATGEWDFFYNRNTGDSMGVTIGKHLLNGLVNDLFGASEPEGVRIYDINTGDFYQPVTFDVSKVNAGTGTTGQIDITTVDGIAPFEYQLLDSESTVIHPYSSSTSSFSGLSASSYSVQVRDSGGTEVTQVVVVS